MGCLIGFFKFVAFLIISAVILYCIYLLFSYSGAGGQFMTRINAFIASVQYRETRDWRGWKEVEVTSPAFYLKIPEDWRQNEDQTVSQFPVPIKRYPGAIYNQVYFSEHLGVMITGYYNDDLVDKLLSLPDGSDFKGEYSSRGPVFWKKVTAGTVESGHKYLILESYEESDPPARNGVYAYIRAGNNRLIILNLVDFDQIGYEMFKKLAASVTLK